MLNLRSTMIATTLLAAVALARCGGETPMTQQNPPVLASVSGNGQNADAGATLANPIVVRVTQDGSAVSGTTVSWSVTAGGGSVNPTTSTTNTSGDASTMWTLGTTPGNNTLQASVAGATGSPVSFTATGNSTTPPPSAASVSVEDDLYDPSSTTIATGGTVTWTWAGSNQHSVTFSAGTSSATQTSGTFARTFATAGTFNYQCAVHGAAMSGTIVVQ